MDSDADARRAFFEQYKNYVQNVLFPTEREVKAILREWKRPGHWRPPSGPEDPRKLRLASPSPVQRVRTRVKRAESVEDKILRRRDVFTEGLCPASFRKMNDTVGARVILYFLSHMPLIDGELRKLDEYFEISQTESPKAYLPEELFHRLALPLQRKEKESGYASIHYILRLKDSKVAVEDRPWFELQVRTITEDAWGEVEHVLGYKPEKTTISVRRQFQIISKQLGAIDEHFNHLYTALTEVHEEVEYKDSDALDPRTLPPELTALGLGCAQNEIDGLLKVLVSRRMSTVAALRAVATPSRLDVVRHTFWNVEGRPPSNFEFIANLAAIAETNDQEEQIARIKDQISFLRAWESIRKKTNPST
jgi:GTP pyrophosphokinase